MSNKIVRSIAYFVKEVDDSTKKKVEELIRILEENNFEVQTKRICSPYKKCTDLEKAVNDPNYEIGIGGVDTAQTLELLDDFLEVKSVHFNLELGSKDLSEKHVDILFKLIEKRPDLTFNFAYAFNSLPSSPFFPSTNYEKDGFSIGLQPTDLAEECYVLEEWFGKMLEVWEEIIDLFGDRSDFLGIDSSIAPFESGKGSFINFIKRLGYNFPDSTTTDIYLRTSKFIKESNPKPIGLCGLMFPCLEDFDLTEEYEKGEFSIERNIYLSLHSGLGIDTYPIGVDEDRARVLDILMNVQGFSNKYKKPLAVRFSSDGKAKIGEKTDFQNEYLKDVIVRAL